MKRILILGQLLALTAPASADQTTKVGNLNASGTITQGSDQVVSKAGIGLAKSGPTMSLASGSGSAGCTLVWLGSAWDCEPPVVNDAPPGTLALSLDGTTFVGYTGAICPANELVDATGSGGELVCIPPLAGSACSPGAWVTGQDAFGNVICSTATPAGLSHVVCYTTLTSGTVTDWSPTCAAGVSAAAADIWVVSGLTGTVTIDGIVASLAGSDGGTKLVINQNTGGFQIDLINGSPSALTADRFVTINANSRFIGNDGAFQMTYQGSAQLWTEHDESSRYTNNLYDEGSTTVVGSVTAASAAITSAITAGSTAFRADGNGVSYAPSGSDVYANYQWVGFNGTAHVVSTFLDDGQGGGSAAHAIALFDAHTHSLRIGSAGSATTADIEALPGAFSGSCGSGSIAQDWASGGTVYLCNAGTWYAGADYAAAIATNKLIKSDGAGNLAASTASDTGSLFTIPEALTQTGIAQLNVTGTASTGIGNTTGTLSLVSSTTTAVGTFNVNTSGFSYTTLGTVGTNAQYTWLQRDVITSTSTWTPNAQTRMVIVHACGGGGGGGGAKGGAAGGGGAGGNIELHVTASSFTAETETIGAFGAGGAATPTNGTGGGDTVVNINGTTYTAKGGAGGPLASSAGFTSGAAPISGTCSSGCDLASGGMPGGTGYATASAGPGASGAGGSGPYGGGGVPAIYTTGNTGGGNATGNCAGGGGGAGSTAATGGNGSPGLEIVDEYR